MLILASGSPRRRDFLDLLAVQYRVEPADIDETPLQGESPVAVVRRLAEAKGVAVADRYPDEWVLSADTVVALDGEIMGKPAGVHQATEMLSRLSGRSHYVHTGIALTRRGEPSRVDHSTTIVRFRHVPTKDIDSYVATGEVFGKAGAYAVQGLGGMLVDRIEGELSTVVGLTLSVVVRLLSEAGIQDLMSPK